MRLDDTIAVEDTIATITILGMGIRINLLLQPHLKLIKAFEIILRPLLAAATNS